MTRVPLSHVVFDAGTQIRASINESVVAEYADRMTDGVEFPPIVLFHDGNQHYLADGFHRFMAARRNQFADIAADVRAGTKQDALWFALGANRAQGQRLTEADKKRAIELAILAWPEKSQNQIAEQIGVNQSSVQRVKEQVMRTHNLPDRTVGKDGKSYPAARSDESKLKMPDRSRAAVAQRRQDIRDMAARGFTSRQIAASIGVDVRSVTPIAKAEGIVIHADRVVGKTQRHDSTRIVETTVMDAENLTADVNLIEFSQLDRASLARWIDSLTASHKSLGAFIRRLKQEQKNAEAA